MRCRICFEQPDVPVVTRCGHVYCKPHIEEWLRNETTCPVCRGTVRKGDLVTVFVEAPDDDDSVGNRQHRPGSRAGTGGGRADGGGGSGGGGSGGSSDTTSEAKESEGGGGPRPSSTALLRGGAGVGAILKSLQREWDESIFERARMQSRIARLEAENTTLKKQVSAALVELEAFYSMTPGGVKALLGSRQRIRTAGASAAAVTMTAAAAAAAPTSADAGGKRNGSSSANSGSRMGRDEFGTAGGAEIDGGGKVQSSRDGHSAGGKTNGAAAEASATPPSSTPTAAERIRTEGDSALPYLYDHAGCPEDVAGNLLGRWELEECFDRNHAEQIHGIAVHPTIPNYVATASWDVTCVVYDLETRDVVSTLEGKHEKGLYAVEFCPTNPNVIGTVSSDRTCQVWEVTTGRHLVSCRGHTDEVNGMAFHPTKPSVMATASDDRSIIVWDLEYREPRQRLLGHRNRYGARLTSTGCMSRCFLAQRRSHFFTSPKFFLFVLHPLILSLRPPPPHSHTPYTHTHAACTDYRSTGGATTRYSPLWRLTGPH